MLKFSLMSGKKPVVSGDNYLGLVTAANFITGDALASAIGLTAGASVNSASDWMKFSLDGKTLYLPKLHLRHTVSWDSLYQRGAVYGTADTGKYPTDTPVLQNRTVTIAGKVYKVRLLKCAGSDPFTPAASGYDVAPGYNSEWNRLMYRVCATVPASQVGPNWVSFTDAELETDSIRYSWGQETNSTMVNYRVIRGYYDVSYLLWGGSSDVLSLIGWRPCLELVA
jgi:hypothetical protein